MHVKMLCALMVRELMSLVTSLTLRIVGKKPWTLNSSGSDGSRYTVMKRKNEQHS